MKIKIEEFRDITYWDVLAYGKVKSREGYKYRNVAPR